MKPATTTGGRAARLRLTPYGNNHPDDPPAPAGVPAAPRKPPPAAPTAIALDIPTGGEE